MKYGALAYLAFVFAPMSVEAATRTVYFSQPGRNVTYDKGLGQQAISECRIYVSNPSTTTQTFRIVAKAEAAASGDFPGVATPPAVGPHTLTGGARLSFTMVFPTFLAGAANRDKKQQLLCSGSIEVSDASDGSPGYLIAGGTLTTFTTSGTLQTTGATTGATLGGGTAIFTQIPITINRGKPF